MLGQFAPGYRVVDQLASVKLTEAARVVEKVLPLNAEGKYLWRSRPTPIAYAAVGASVTRRHEKQSAPALARELFRLRSR